VEDAGVGSYLSVANWQTCGTGWTKWAGMSVFAKGRLSNADTNFEEIVEKKT